MKTPVAVALIQMGAVLVMLPVMSEAWHQHELLSFVSKSGVPSVHIEGNLPGNTRVMFLLLGCITGIGMIVWTLTVDYAGAARASLLNTAAPLIGVPLSALFLRERVTAKIAAGTLLSVVGIWMIL